MLFVETSDLVFNTNDVPIEASCVSYIFYVQLSGRRSYSDVIVMPHMQWILSGMGRGLRDNGKARGMMRGYVRGSGVETAPGYSAIKYKPGMSL